MTVRVSKPEFNLRDKLSQLDLPIGSHGSQLLKSESAAESFQLVRGGRRRLNINGDMLINQRGTITGVTGNTETYGGPDRYTHKVWGNYGTWSIFQDTDVPDVGGFEYSLKYACTTAGSSSDGALATLYRMEGNDCMGFNYGTANAKSVTLSFWAKSNLTGDFSVNFENEQNDDASCNFRRTINATNTWQKFEVTCSGDTYKALTWGNQKAFVFEMFWGAVGATYADGTPSEGWEETDSSIVNDRRGAHCTMDFQSSTTNYVCLTGVQLEFGESATPYENWSYGEELARCQRYYYRHCNDQYESIGTGLIYYSGYGYVSCYFPVTMRTTPSFVHTAGTSGAYTYQVLVSNQALYYHTLGTDTNKDSLNMAVVTVGGPSISGRAGESFVLSAHTSTNVAFSAEV
tara:strand:+ start:2693 stop:3901 length:1209 start_codon:yes stop_codon:yes gene_type:complete